MTWKERMDFWDTLATLSDAEIAAVAEEQYPGDAKWHHFLICSRNGQLYWWNRFKEIDPDIDARTARRMEYHIGAARPDEGTRDNPKPEGIAQMRELLQNAYNKYKGRNKCKN